jgi:hypothetical protein
MIALLDQLKSTVHEFVAREEKLNGEWRLQSSTELNTFAARNQAQETAAMNRELAEEAAMEAETERLQARFAGR